MHGQHVAKLQSLEWYNNNAKADASTILKMGFWCKTDTERCIKNSLLAAKVGHRSFKMGKREKRS